MALRPSVYPKASGDSIHWNDLNILQSFGTFNNYAFENDNVGRVLDFNLISGNVILNRDKFYHFKSFTLGTGTSISTTISSSTDGLPLVLYCEEDVIINGLINLQGQSGASSSTSPASGGLGPGYKGSIGSSVSTSGNGFVTLDNSYYVFGGMTGSGGLVLSFSGTSDQPNTLQNVFNLIAGAGGGGGMDSGANLEGGAGGAGGGALLILSMGSIYISSTGSINLTGGIGGYGDGGAGGGGGGGGCFVACSVGPLINSGLITFSGGCAGGSESPSALVIPGGGGAGFNSVGQPSGATNLYGGSGGMGAFYSFRINN
jgi:hypothetical protein